MIDHQHDWKPLQTDQWDIPVEEYCDCGAKRWRKHLRSEWHDGARPDPLHADEWT